MRDGCGVCLGNGLDNGLGVSWSILNWGGGGSSHLKNTCRNCKTVDGGTVSSIVIGNCCVGTRSPILLPTMLHQVESWSSIDII